MSQLDASSPSHAFRSSKVKRFMKLAGAALIYIGIAAIFAFVTFILWLISLLIA